MSHIRERAYAKYQLDWMQNHGMSLMDVIMGLRKMQESFEADEFCYPIDCLFEEWESDAGFDGELYVCFDEFVCSEYLDADYMKKLLTAEEYNAYLDDVMNCEEEKDDDDR